MKAKLLDENYHPGPRWLIVSLAPSEMENDSFGNERIIAINRRPKYLHETREEAEKEALRLASVHGGYQRTFVIFEAVAFTEKRTPFEIAAQTVIVLEPISQKVLEIPEKPRRKKPLKRAL